MRTKHYVPDLQKVVIASAASRTGHCEEAEGRRGNLFLSFPRRRESIFTTYESRDFAFHFFPFRPMAFTSYPQDHRSCLLDEAGSFVLFCLGRGLLPPPGPDTFYEICKVARLFLPANQHPGLFMFFPFYAEAGKTNPASAIFKLCAAVSSAFFLFISPFVFGLVSWVLSLLYLCPS